MGAAYILIVISYLGGSAWGPQVSMQELSNKDRCEEAKMVVLEGVKEMNKTNLAGGSSRRDIIKAECIQK